jgi:hypothetical protein
MPARRRRLAPPRHNRTSSSTSLPIPQPKAASPPTKAERAHLATNRRHKTPVQGFTDGNPTSTGSPSASEHNTNGARTNRRAPYSTMASPPPPRPRRRETNPRSTSTPSDRRESSGLHRLAKPQGTSEARKTAGSAGLCCPDTRIRIPVHDTGILRYAIFPKTRIRGYANIYKNKNK